MRGPILSTKDRRSRSIGIKTVVPSGPMQLWGSEIRKHFPSTGGNYDLTALQAMFLRSLPGRVVSFPVDANVASSSRRTGRFGPLPDGSNLSATGRSRPSGGRSADHRRSACQRRVIAVIACAGWWERRHPQAPGDEPISVLRTTEARPVRRPANFLKPGDES
jgi:hypothetical protein